VGVLDAAENRGRLLAALGVQVSHSPHGTFAGEIVASPVAGRILGVVLGRVLYAR